MDTGIVVKRDGHGHGRCGSTAERRDNVENSATSSSGTRAEVTASSAGTDWSANRCEIGRHENS